MKRQTWTSSGEKEKKDKAEETEGSTMRLQKRKRSLKLQKEYGIKKREKENKYKSSNQIACEKIETAIINGHQIQSLGEKSEKENTIKEANTNLGSRINSQDTGKKH